MKPENEPNTSIKEYGPFKMIHRLGTVDIDVLDETFVQDLYLSGAPDYQLQPDHIILDIGSHLGPFAIQCGARLTSGKVIAVEPSKETFDLLEKNIDLNGAKNIVAVHAALAGQEGEIKLFHDLELGNWGHTITKKVSESYETVKAVTLAGLMRSQGLERANLLKMNCEGAEFDILLSADHELLHKFEHMIVLYHLDLVEGFSRDELIAHIRNAGFYVKHRCESSERGWLIAIRKDLPRPNLRMLIIGSAVKETLMKDASSQLHELVREITKQGVRTSYLMQTAHRDVEPYAFVKYEASGFEHFGLNLLEDLSFHPVHKEVQTKIHQFIQDEQIDVAHIDSAAGWPLSLTGLLPVIGIPSSYLIDDLSLIYPQMTLKIENIASAKDRSELINRCVEDYFTAHFQGAAQKPSQEEFEDYLNLRMELAEEHLKNVTKLFFSSPSLEDLFVRCGLVKPGQGEQYPGCLLDQFSAESAETGPKDEGSRVSSVEENFTRKLARAHIELAWSLIG